MFLELDREALCPPCRTQGRRSSGRASALTLERRSSQSLDVLPQDKTGSLLHLCGTHSVELQIQIVALAKNPGIFTTESQETNSIL